MTVQERIRLSTLIIKIKDNEAIAKRVGLQIDESKAYESKGENAKAVVDVEHSHLSQINE